ncbi:HdeD family acid-resistance protein [soil metagenome]
MTDNSDTVTDQLGDTLADLGKGIWWWVLIRGILAVAFGIIALIAPGAALTAIALVFGAYALIDGIMASIHAVRVRNSYKKWGWLLVQGIVSALAGLAALILPGFFGLFGGLFVLWTIVIYNIMHGAAGIASAAGAESGRAKNTGIIAGILTLVFGIILGVLILLTPGATLLGLVWAVGIYAIIFGVTLAITAIQVRTAASKGTPKVTPKTA